MIVVYLPPQVTGRMNRQIVIQLIANLTPPVGVHVGGVCVSSTGVYNAISEGVVGGGVMKEPYRFIHPHSLIASPILALVDWGLWI